MRHLQRVLEEPVLEGERYRLGPLLGQGGMGVVYQATDLLLGREVALKVLRPEFAEGAAVARFGREAQILAQLEHPGIVAVHDVGSLRDGRPYYVMKLVRGIRLDDFARPLALSERLRIYLRICETIDFAHVTGVIHRDLKPGNIMIGAFGEVLVLDWGIARVLTAQSEATGGSPTSPPAEGDTASGTVLGTPGYMAPEQALGQIDRVDARTDVFALGAILRDLAASGASARPPLQSIWSKALSASPDARYHSAAALGADVARFLDSKPVEAHRESWLERAGRFYHTYQTAILLVLAYLAMRLLFLAARGF
ncbi:MAG: serine/threonine-protein kinase [Gemmatimonadales bacterium]